MQQWHLYLVRTADGSLYTGIAIDVDRRLEDHRRGGTRGSKYLRSRGPLEIAFRLPIGNRALAQTVEARIKKLSKAEKESVVTDCPGHEKLLELLAIEPPESETNQLTRKGDDHGKSTSSPHSGGN